MVLTVDIFLTGYSKHWTLNAQDKPAYLAGFPYVNGRLFNIAHYSSNVYKRPHAPCYWDWARDLRSADIFGSMFRQSSPEALSSIRPNILKTIEPLFS